MKAILRSVGVSIMILTLIFPLSVVAEERDGERDETQRKIVVYEEGVTLDERERILGDTRTRRTKVLSLVPSDVVELTAEEEAILRRNPRIARIDEDVVVSIVREERPDVRVHARRRTGTEEVVAQAQNLPWGVDRVDAELVWPQGNTANPIKVAIIDTGISSSHPDLKANIKGGINTINARRGWNDDNGHGSHVAGTVAAISNNAGVVGVAHQADLYAVKVLGSNGSGYLSDIIEGIQWSMQQKVHVINMSLGTGSNVQSFHDAVIAARNAGITVVAAAGNNGGSVIYPAAYPEVIAVSATDSNNNLASFSSRGAAVDLAAPGVSIYSTYKGTGYATLSGTSMASPHVAGAVALLINTPVGAHDQNGNGKWDPAEVQARLEATATDLGAGGKDTLYGAGLVNAFAAVQ